MNNHRQLIAPLTASLCGLVLFCAGSLKADDTIDLKTNFPNGEQFRIIAQFEHSGNVVIDSKPTEQAEKKVTLLPLKVDAKLSYFQKVTGAQQAVRYYDQANANISLDHGKTNPSLGDANQLIIARLKQGEGRNIEMASISDTLAQTELELIQHAADPLTHSFLFNKSDLKKGQQWEPELDGLAKFLGVQKIHRSDVKLQLKTYDDKTARVYITGAVEADIDDVSTEMEISGIVVIDRKEQLVASLKVGIQETRMLGQIAPGFEGSSKIELQIKPTKGTPKLALDALVKLTKNRKIQHRVNWKSTSGQFELKFQPRWKMIAEEQDAAILRYLEDGNIMAQCNVVLLPPRPANNSLKLEDYKKEVAKIMEADEHARLTNASQTQTESGLRMVRVVVASEEEGLPINWIYCHVASKDGRQITFVFTMAESIFTQMNPIAEQLVNEFVFNELPQKVASNKSTSGSDLEKPARKPTAKKR